MWFRLCARISFLAEQCSLTTPRHRVNGGGSRDTPIGTGADEMTAKLKSPLRFAGSAPSAAVPTCDDEGRPVL